MTDDLIISEGIFKLTVEQKAVRQYRHLYHDEIKGIKMSDIYMGKIFDSTDSAHYDKQFRQSHRTSEEAIQFIEGKWNKLDQGDHRLARLLDGISLILRTRQNETVLEWIAKKIESDLEHRSRYLEKIVGYLILYGLYNDFIPFISDCDLYKEMSQLRASSLIRPARERGLMNISPGRSSITTLNVNKFPDLCNKHVHHEDTESINIEYKKELKEVP